MHSILEGSPSKEGFHGTHGTHSGSATGKAHDCHVFVIIEEHGTKICQSHSILCFFLYHIFLQLEIDFMMQVYTVMHVHLSSYPYYISILMVNKTHLH